MRCIFPFSFVILKMLVLERSENSFLLIIFSSNSLCSRNCNYVHNVGDIATT